MTLLKCHEPPAKYEPPLLMEPLMSQSHVVSTWVVSSRACGQSQTGNFGSKVVGVVKINSIEDDRNLYRSFTVKAKMEGPHASSCVPY